MAKLREKMETRQFLRLVAEARRRYAIDPRTGCSTLDLQCSAEQPSDAAANAEHPASSIAATDEPAEPNAPQAPEHRGEAAPEPAAPTPRREESA